jgi:hypothetical protein
MEHNTGRRFSTAFCLVSPPIFKISSALIQKQVSSISHQIVYLFFIVVYIISSYYLYRSCETDQHSSTRISNWEVFKLFLSKYPQLYRHMIIVNFQAMLPSRRRKEPSRIIGRSRIIVMQKYGVCVCDYSVYNGSNVWKVRKLEFFTPFFIKD